MYPSIFEEDLFPTNFLEEKNGIDIYETDDSVIVEAQVPGIKQEDVSITVEGNILTITAEHIEKEEDKKKVVYKSTRQTSFHYATTLPRMVNANKAEAEVENGLVKVTIPKAEEEKPKRIVVKKK
jgi:HSP20 family protein